MNATGRHGTERLRAARTRRTCRDASVRTPDGIAHAGAASPVPDATCYHCVSYSEAPSGVERAVLTRRTSERHPFAPRFDIFASFSLAFFGIGLTRLWYQYNLYNLHFSADSGIATVAANLIRVGVIVVLLVIARKAELSQRARRILVWGSMVLMTSSCMAERPRSSICATYSQDWASSGAQACGWISSTG